MTGSISKKSLKDKTVKQTEQSASERPRQPVASGPEADLSALQDAAGNQAVSELVQSNTQDTLSGQKAISAAIDVPIRSQGQPLEPSIRIAHSFSLIPVHAGGHSSIQPKLKVNTPEDRYEQEADRVAKQVMSFTQPSQSDQLDVVSNDTESVQGSVSNNSSGGQALTSETRQFFESRFGHNSTNVRVHADRPANESALTLQSRAYTVGNDIVFAPGEYRPQTREGRQLLAHELAHVVQQSCAPHHTRPRTLTLSLSRVPSSQVQRKLIATGDAAGFAALANSIVAVQYEIRVSASGEVYIHTTNIQGPPTRDAQELLSTLRTAISDPKTTTIEFIRGSRSARASDRSVIVGNYSLSRVDLDDVEAFGLTTSHSRQGDNAAVQLVHEITEQYRKQVHGEGFQVAHRAGYAAQERVLGATLVNETPMTQIGGGLGEVTTTYRYPDGREVDVITRINFRTGQIVNVRRVIR
jgi:hypothetical protein